MLGAPRQTICEGPEIRTVAVLGGDYIGQKPRLAVQEGDIVGRGDPIFSFKDSPDIKVTAPQGGRIMAINRGARRVLISVEIQIDSDAGPAADFSSVGDPATAEGLAERLATSGLWTSFRTRPYSKVPDPATRPAAIYVTAMDSEPLSADAAVILAEERDAFRAGLQAVSALTDGKTYLCQSVGADVPGADVPGVEVAAFSGPHPSGLPGTHIHFLEPAASDKTVWTIWYQDVIAIGHLIQTGELYSVRVIAISGRSAQILVWSGQSRARRPRI